ncbi:MAG TPA: response regulator [Acidimicrobiales bacterium]|nr:response regulator [Acidimicrobiales bacterium]
MNVLIASDSATVRSLVRESVPDPSTTVVEVTRGVEVVPAIQEQTPDIAIIDLQIGKMGGMAVCQELHLEAGAGRLPGVRILMLLDRRADVFLARRSHAKGWVVKPLDPIRLGRAMREVLAGRRYDDESYRPPTVPLPT